MLVRSRLRMPTPSERFSGSSAAVASSCCPVHPLTFGLCCFLSFFSTLTPRWRSRVLVHLCSLRGRTAPERDARYGARCAAEFRFFLRFFTYLERCRIVDFESTIWSWSSAVDTWFISLLHFALARFLIVCSFVDCGSSGQWVESHLPRVRVFLAICMHSWEIRSKRASLSGSSPHL